MSLVRELQRLIQMDGTVSGRVISVLGTNVVVSTASGQMEVSANGDIHVGDLVTVDAGRATNKHRNGDTQIFLI
jgi:hypothetical protein